MKTVNLQTSEQWRNWLAKHHESEAEVWLIFHKRHTGQPSIAYEDAVDEALCFGWIDSLIKRLDETRYARKFTPRKPDSRWSTLNRNRYARLAESGRLTEAGQQRAPTDRNGDAPPRSALKMTSHFQRVLKSYPAAWACFNKLAPSHQRRYIGWIESAKRQETKERRAQEAIRMLEAGKNIGLK